jgi:hypothetical protein
VKNLLSYVRTDFFYAELVGCNLELTRCRHVCIC